VLSREDADSVAPALARLHLEAQEVGMALGLLSGHDPALLAETYAQVVRGLDGGERVFVVAEADDAILGMGQLVRSSVENGRHRAEIQRLAVAASARGSGVGRALMAALEDEARRRGITLVWLTTHAGTDAQRFYEAIGYTLSGVIPQYARLPDGTLAANAFFYREL
jgi:ribosomal protein S18 acetylase RimI-like enzyme